MRSNKNQLIVDYIPLAYKIAYKYKYKGIELEELICAAMEGLVKAYNYWDESKGSFANAIELKIQAEITNLFKKQSIRFNMYREHNYKLFDEDSNSNHLIDIQSCGRPLPDKLLEEKDRWDFIYNIIDELSERQKYVIEHRFLTKEIKTLKEISETLGISHQRVAEIETQGIKNIRNKVNVFNI